MFVQGVETHLTLYLGGDPLNVSLFPEKDTLGVLVRNVPPRVPINMTKQPTSDYSFHLTRPPAPVQQMVENVHVAKEGDGALRRVSIAQICFTTSPRSLSLDHLYQSDIETPTVLLPRRLSTHCRTLNEWLQGLAPFSTPSVFVLGRGLEEESLSWERSLHMASEVLRELERVEAESIVETARKQGGPQHAALFEEFQRTQSKARTTAIRCRNALTVLAHISAPIDVLYSQDLGTIINGLRPLIHILSTHWRNKDPYLSAVLPSLLRQITQHLLQVLLTDFSALPLSWRELLQAAHDGVSTTHHLELFQEHVSLGVLAIDTLRQECEGAQFGPSIAPPDVFQRLALLQNRLLKCEEVLKDTRNYHDSRQFLENWGMSTCVHSYFTLLSQTMVVQCKEVNIFQDFADSKFDSCFGEYCALLEVMEESLVISINSFLENFRSMAVVLENILKLQKVFVHRPRIKAVLSAKCTLLFNTFGNELDNLLHYYEGNKDSVYNSIVGPRHLPLVGSNVLWLRHVLWKAETHFQVFQNGPVISQGSKEFRKVVKKINKLGIGIVTSESTLKAYWLGHLTSMQGLLHGYVFERVGEQSSSPLHIRLAGAAELRQMIAETRVMFSLAKADFPQENTVLALCSKQRGALLHTIDTLSYAISEREALSAQWDNYNFDSVYLAVAMVDVAQEVNREFEAGLRFWTWLSAGLTGYAQKLLATLEQARLRLNASIDIIQNLIEATLKIIETKRIVDWGEPTGNSSTLTYTDFETFATDQQKKVEDTVQVLIRKNRELESAVMNLCELNDASPSATQSLVNHVCQRVSECLFTNILESLRSMRQRLLLRKGVALFCMRATPDATDGSLELAPSMDDLESLVTSIATNAVQSIHGLTPWRLFPHLSHVLAHITRSKDVVKETLWLSGAMQFISDKIDSSLASYRRTDTRNLARRYPSQDEISRMTVEELRMELSSFEEILLELDMVSPQITVGCVVVDVMAVKDYLHRSTRPQRKSLCEEYVACVNTRMATQVKYLMGIVNQVTLQPGMITLAEAQKVMHGVASFHDMELQYHEMSRSAEELLIVLKEARSDPGWSVCINSLEKAKMEFQTLYKSLHKITDESKSEVQLLYQQLLSDFRWQRIKFSVSERCFRNFFAASVPTNTKVDTELAAFFENFNRCQQYTEALVTLHHQIHDGESFFSMQHSRHPELHRTIRDVDLLVPVRDRFEEFKQLEARRYTIVWGNVSPALAHSEAESVCDLLQRTESLEETGVGQWNAYGLFVDRLRKCHTQLLLIEKLTAPFLRERHMEQLMHMVGVEWQGADKFSDTTFRDLCSYGLDECVEEIDDMIATAKNEVVIEIAKTQLTAQWADRCASFDLSKFEINVSSSRDILADLEDGKQMLSGLLLDPYSTPFREELRRQMQLLSSARETLSKLLEVQALWMFSSAIFSNDQELCRDLPEDSKRFATSDKRWRTMILGATQDEIVLRMCRNPEILSTLPILFQQLSTCRKQLVTHIGSKTDTFARLNYVSQGTLMDIIAACSSDPTLIARYLPLLYGHLTTLKFKELPKDEMGNTRPVAIVGFGSIEGEVVSLRNPVDCTVAVEVWLLELHKEIKASIAALVVQSFDAATVPPIEQWNTEVIQKVFRSFPRQVCELQLGAQLTRCLSENLHPIPSRVVRRSGGAKTHHARSNVITNNSLIDLKARFVSVLADPHLTSLERGSLQRLLMLTGEAVDIDTTLQKLRPVQSSAHCWMGNIRLIYNRDRKDITVHLLDCAMPYSYEYVGTTNRLVMTHDLQKTFCGILQCIASYKGVLLHGHGSGPGKSSGLQELARVLGKICFVFDIDTNALVSQVLKTVKGAAMMGDWCVLKDVNIMPAKDLTNFTHGVSQLYRDLYSNRATTNFDTGTDNEKTKMIPIHRNFAIFAMLASNVEYKPHYMQAAFRPVFVLPPDINKIIRIKLLSLGCPNEASLSDRITRVFQRCTSELPYRPDYDFGIRSVQRVLHKLTEVWRGTVVSPIQMVATTVLGVLSLMMHTEDLSILRDIVQTSFPSTGLERPNHPMDFESVCRKMSYEPTKAFVTKCVALHECIESVASRGIIVLGTWECGKTSLLNVVTSVTPHREIAVLPSCLNSVELYGSLRVSGLEEIWMDGVLTRAIRECATMTSKETWILCDGVVKDNWLHPLRSAMEGGFVCLACRDKISLPKSAKIVIETSNIEDVSPSLVSRFAVVHLEEGTVGWTTVAQRTLKEILPSHFHKDKTMFLCDLIRDNVEKVYLEFPVPSQALSLLHFSTSVVRVLRTLVMRCDQVRLVLADLTNLFWYSVAWVLLTAMSDKKQQILLFLQGKFTDHLLISSNPFECYFDPIEHHWSPFEDFTITSMAEPFSSTEGILTLSMVEGTKMSKPVFVQTPETQRLQYWMSMCVAAKQPFVVCGSFGTGKRSALKNYIQTSAPKSHKVLSSVSFRSLWNFSKAMHPVTERRVGNEVGPRGNSKDTILLVLEDVSLECPTQTALLGQIDGRTYMYSSEASSIFGVVPPDLVRMTNFVACATAERQIRSRALKNFIYFSMGTTSDATLMLIVSTLLNPEVYHSDFTMVQQLLQRTVKDIARYLPKVMLSPLTLIIRVCEGLLLRSEEVDAKQDVIALYKHEVSRIVYDGLENATERAALRQVLQLPEDGTEILFASLKGPSYELVPDYVTEVQAARDRMADGLCSPRSYNPNRNKAGDAFLLDTFDFGATLVKPMSDLQLFPRVCANVIKMTRLFLLRRHALVVGSSHAGKHDVCRLAAYIFDAKFRELSRKSTDIVQWLWDCILEASESDIVACASMQNTQVNPMEAVGLIHALVSTADFPGMYTEKNVQEILERAKHEKNVSSRHRKPEELPQWSDHVNRLKNKITFVICLHRDSSTMASVKKLFPTLFHSFGIIVLEDWGVEAFLQAAQETVASEVTGCSSDIAVDEKRLQILAEFHVQMLRHFTFNLQHFKLCVRTIERVCEKSRRESQDHSKSLQDGLMAIERASKYINEQEAIHRTAQREIESVGDDLHGLSKDTDSVRETILGLQRTVEDAGKALDGAKAAHALEVEVVKAEMDAVTALKDRALECLTVARKGDWEKLRISRTPNREVQEFFDCAAILLHRPLTRHNATLVKYSGTVQYYMDRKFRQLRIEPSWALNFSILEDPTFPDVLLRFTEERVSCINEETMELLLPYQGTRVMMMTETLEAGQRATMALLRWLGAISQLRALHIETFPCLSRVKASEIEVQQKQRIFNANFAALQGADEKLEQLGQQIVNKESYRKNLILLNQKRLQDIASVSKLLTALRRARVASWEGQIATAKNDAELIMGDVTRAVVLGFYGKRLSPELCEKEIKKYLIDPMKASGYAFSDTSSDWVRRVMGSRWIPRAILHGLPSRPHVVESAAILSVVHDVVMTDDSRTWKIILIDSEGTAPAILKVLNLTQSRAIKVMQSHANMKISSNHLLLHIAGADCVSTFTDLILAQETPRVRQDLMSQECVLHEMTLAYLDRDQRLAEVLGNHLVEGLSPLREDIIAEACMLEDSVTEIQDRMLKENDVTRRVNMETEVYVPLINVIASLYRCTRLCREIHRCYTASFEQYVTIIRRALASTPRDVVVSRHVNTAIRDVKRAVLGYMIRGAFRSDHDLIQAYYALCSATEANEVQPEELTILLDLLQRTGTVDPLHAVSYLEEQRPSQFRQCLLALKGSEWKQWLESPHPADATTVRVPGFSQDSPPTAMERLIFLVATRPEHTVQGLRSFCDAIVGKGELVAWESDLENLFVDTKPWIPVLFLVDVTDPATEPLSIVEAFAKKKKRQLRKCLGFQSQDSEFKTGIWTFLHFVDSLPPDELLDLTCTLPEWESTPDSVHRETRLWMSLQHSAVSTSLEVLLSRSLRLVAQPPTGVRATLRYTMMHVTEDDRKAFRRPEWTTSLCIAAVVQSFLLGCSRRHGPLSFPSIPLLVPQTTMRSIINAFHGLFLIFGEDTRTPVAYQALVDTCFLMMAPIGANSRDSAMLHAVLQELYVPADQLHPMWLGYVQRFEEDASSDYPLVLSSAPHAVYSSPNRSITQLVELLQSEAGENSAARKALKKTSHALQDMLDTLLQQVPSLSVDLLPMTHMKTVTGSRGRFFEQEARAVHTCLTELRRSLTAWSIDAARGCLEDDITYCILNECTPEQWLPLSPCDCRELRTWLKHVHMQVAQLSAPNPPSIHWLGGYHFPLALIASTCGGLDGNLIFETTKMTALPPEEGGGGGGILACGVHLVSAGWQRNRLRLLSHGECSVCDLSTVHITRKDPLESTQSTVSVPCYHHVQQRGRITKRRDYGCEGSGLVCCFDVNAVNLTQHHVELHGVHFILNSY